LARILIIKNNDNLREVLCQLLKYEGYDVVDAPNGKAGMRLLHEEHCDMVITDIFMPEKDGIEVIMELRDDFPDVKIIAISGGGHIFQISFLSEAKKMGAHHILSKPFKPKEFLEAIRNLEGQSNTRDL
jgi:DNA-binding response OmpR family regulator